MFSPMLDSCSIDNISIEIYENRFFRTDFTYIHVYLFRLSFLTTLNMYKNYFKDRHTHIRVYLFRLSFLTTLNIYKNYFKGRHT